MNLIIMNVVNEDVGADVAVVDYTILICSTHDAASIIIGSDAAVGQDNTVNGCALGISEDAIIEFTSTIHTDSADGKSLTIVAAFEIFSDIAYAVEINLLAAGVVPVAGVGEGNVGRLLERLVVGVVARVDVSGKVDKVLRVLDFVIPARRVVRQAADGFLCPRRRRGEQHHEQHRGCPENVSCCHIVFNAHYPVYGVEVEGDFVCQSCMFC